MILISLLLIVLCCVIIWRASDGFEVASEYLGRNLSEGVRGATINAIGSSMPELFTTLFFLFVLKDKDGFAGGIGTTAGSAIFNGMIIPAAVIFIVILKRIASSVKVTRMVLLRDGISLLVCELILILLLGSNVLNWTHGLVLMALYGLYTIVLLRSMKEGDDEEEEDEVEEEDEEGSDPNFWKDLITLNLEPIFIRSNINSSNAWQLLLFAMLIIGSACFLLVKACEWLGDGLNIPIYFVAVVLASAATSVPDTILSMKDAEKGNFDDAVSNALGSNIFDVCFALGFPLFLFTIFNGPIEMNPETVVNVSELRIMLFVLTFVAFIIYIAKSSMGMMSAILLISIYVFFVAYIYGQATGTEWSSQISAILLKINSWIENLRFWQ